MKPRQIEQKDTNVNNPEHQFFLCQANVTFDDLKKMNEETLQKLRGGIKYGSFFANTLAKANAILDEPMPNIYILEIEITEEKVMKAGRGEMISLLEVSPICKVYPLSDNLDYYDTSTQEFIEAYKKACIEGFDTPTGPQAQPTLRKDSDDLIKDMLSTSIGSPKNLKNTFNNTTLLDAIEKGNIELVKTFLEQKADINIQNQKGDSPLLLALKLKNDNIVSLLLDNKANLKIENIEGETPFSLTLNYPYGKNKILTTLGKISFSEVSQIEEKKQSLQSKIAESKDSTYTEYLWAVKILNPEIDGDKEVETALIRDKYLDDKRITNFISTENLWKLVIDAKDHPYGRLVYDDDNDYDIRKNAQPKESGYIDAAEIALAFVLKTLHTPLTENFVRRLHWLLTSKIETVNFKLSHYLSPDYEEGSSFAPWSMGCPINNITTTHLGLEEMIKYSFFKASIPFFKDTVHLSTGTLHDFEESLEFGFRGKGGVSGTTKEKIDNLLKFIDEYNALIQKAGSDPEKILLTITRFIKKLEVAHFFIDGNLRLVKLIKLKLLAENHLPLTCMQDPNIIDGYSTFEIAHIIVKGMETYKKIHPCEHSIPKLGMSEQEQEDFFTLKTPQLRK